MAKKRRMITPKSEPEEDEEPNAGSGSGSGADSAQSPASPEPESREPISSPEPIRNLLEPLTKDQLVDLLSSAASSHPDVMDEVRKTADVDPAHRKIFVHGLAFDTETESLLSTFKEFGEIEECNMVKDKATGKCKGYAFILFKKRSSARKAISEPQKRIGTRMTACQMASVGPVGGGQPAALAMPVSEYTQRKIFVSNVGEGLDLQKLLAFFGKYGEIEEGPLGLDKVTGKPRGFILLVYKSVESAKKVLEEPHKNFNGHILHCQKAIDGPKQSKQGCWNVPQHPQQHGLGWNQPQMLLHGAQFSRPMDNIGFGGGGGMVGVEPISPTNPEHLMAPSGGSGMGFNYNQGGINPAIGQALNALLTTPAAGLLGLTNMLGSAGNQAVPVPMVMRGGGYGNQAARIGSNNHGGGGGYGGHPQTHGGGYLPQKMSARGGPEATGYIAGVPPYSCP